VALYPPRPLSALLNASSAVPSTFVSDIAAAKACFKPLAWFAVTLNSLAVVDSDLSEAVTTVDPLFAVDADAV